MTPMHDMSGHNHSHIQLCSESCPAYDEVKQRAIVDATQNTMLQVSLDQASERVGAWAIDKGFREPWFLAAELDEVGRQFIDGKDKGVTPADPERLGILLRKAASELRTSFLGMKLALIHSEISEALETLRKTGANGVQAGEGNFGEELGDTIIRLLDLAQLAEVSLGHEVVDKIAVNKDRPYKHGKVV